MISRLIQRCGLAGMALSLSISTSCAIAGDYDVDRPGGVDHPMISRYAGSTLYMYGDDNYGTAQLAVSEKGKPVLRSVEGRISNKIYWAPKGRSPLEIFRNYQRALTSAGFTALLACETAQCEKLGVQQLVSTLTRTAKWQDNTPSVTGIFNSGNQPFFHYISASKTSGGSVVHVQIGLVGGSDSSPYIQGRVQQFVQIIESAQVEEGKVTVVAKDMGSSLKRDGKIALYGILFDTGKAVVKAESGPTLEEMARTLKTEPALKVFIVGHTDNEGTVDANVALSQNRAEAVVDTLNKRYGIAADRLQARGVANFAPVANNLNEETRAKNRRVEMVVR